VGVQALEIDVTAFMTSEQATKPHQTEPGAAA